MEKIPHKGDVKLTLCHAASEIAGHGDAQVELIARSAGEPVQTQHDEANEG
jgi:hypothetical protein